jgi:hypothetical protein
MPIDIVIAWYYKYWNNRDSTFMFGGQKYNYLYHSYNTTWDNPRCVEVPIIQRIIQENSGKRILEIGNVLYHYLPCYHDVIDLTERYPGVINQDIVTFCPENKYDLVVSISTFEHIGCWEKGVPEDPEKLLRAIQNVVDNVLVSGGKFVLTVPLGQNLYMEKCLYNQTIRFDKLDGMRQERDKTWKELSWYDIYFYEFSAFGEWKGKEQTVLIGESWRIV